MLNDVLSSRLKLVFALFSILTCLSRELGLYLLLLFKTVFSRFGHAWIVRRVLSLQLVNVEATEFASKFGLATLSQLQVSVMVENHHLCQSLFTFNRLAVDLMINITGTSYHLENILEVADVDSFASGSLHELPKVFKKFEIWLGLCHVLGEESH